MTQEIKRRYREGRRKYLGTKCEYFLGYDSLEGWLKYVDSRARGPHWQKALEVLQPKAGGTILDFGAGGCWASYLFSKMGCQVSALDFDMHNDTGLYSSKKLQEITGLSFNLVAGDCEQMPFKDESFDIAFGSGILHHAEDLNKMVSETARVVKEGGLVMAINEANRGLFQSERRLIARHPAVSFGVNEHFPTYFDYVNSFKKAGLADINTFLSIDWTAWEEKINQMGLLKRSTYKLAFALLKPLSKFKLMSKFILVFWQSGIIILAKKKQPRPGANQG